MAKAKKKALTLKTLNRSNVWDVQENDIFRMWEAAEKDADLADNSRHYTNVIKSAFDVEVITVDKPEVIKKYEARGYKVGQVRLNENTKVKWAIKKKAILRITDLTYENIRHITAIKLLEVLERNFGSGWESLSQSVRDIVETGFDISTTTLPKDRLKKKGGMYEKKVADGFEVLEIPKGTWVEAIFAKEKPEEEKPEPIVDDEEDVKEFLDDEEEDLPDIDDHFNDPDEDDDQFDDDRLTEESYRTTFDEEQDLSDLEAAEVADDEEY